MSNFLCNKRHITYLRDDRRIYMNTYVFDGPPIERAGNLRGSYYMQTMSEEQFTEEYESLRTWFELSEASRDHYKTERDNLKVEIAKFKDGSVTRNYEPSFPPVCRAKFHGLSFREFEDISGNSKLGRRSLNLHDILLERLTEQEKTITLLRLRNDSKKQDTRVKRLENSVRELKADNNNLQGVQEELKKKERELTKTKDKLQLVSKKLNETKTELGKVQKLKDVEHRSKEELERKARTYEKDIKHLKSINEKTVEPQNLKILKLEHDLKRKEQEIKSLQKSLESNTDEASDCKSLRSRLQETKGVLSAVSKEHEQNLQNLKQALAKVDEIKKERDSDRVANHNLEKQIQQLKNEIEQFHFMAKYQKEISKKSKMEDINRSEMEKELKKNEIQIASLKDQLHQAKRKLTETESELREIQTRRTEQNLQTQLYRFEKESEQLHLKANRQEAAVSKSSKMKDSERSEMEEELKERELQITNLNNQLQQTKRKLMETESELRKTKTMRSDQILQNEVQRLKKEIEQLRLEANRQEAAVSKTSKMKDSERSEMEEELKKKELQITNLNNQLQQTKRKLAETESELRETKTRRSDQTLQNEVQCLKKENEQLHLKANRQEAAVSKTSKMKDTERSEMEEELKQKELQIIILNDQLQQTKRKLSETESELRETKTRRSNQTLQNEVQCLKKEIEQLHLKANRQEAAVSKTSKMEDSERSEMKEELKKREVQITFLNDQLTQEKRKLMETESELQDTKTRLSKAMGNKLTDNNPNIADLSDKNRPVKLAERFGELYDNQWTDAYDIIGKYFDTEERTLGELLNILQEIFCFCKTSWAKQMEDLLKALWFSANPEDVPEVNKILKDCKKTAASVAMRNLYEIYIARLQHSADETSRIALEIRPFVKECLEICWLMMIQDPPVVFAPNAVHGSKLNTDIYKPYTKSGTHVEYTVWPAMLLHENGPVLAKGVAQGYKKE